MLELYEQNKSGGANPSRSSDPGPSSGVVNRSKGGEAVPSSNGHHWNQNSSNVADKGDKSAQAGKNDEVVPSSRRDDEYEVSASHAPSSGYEKHENGQLDNEYEPAYENGSVTISVQETVVETSRTVKSTSNGAVKHESKEELIVGNLEEGQIKEELREKKQTTETRVKSESGTLLRKTRVKVEVEDRKSNIVDGLGGREVTEAKSSLEEREVEDVVESKPVAEVQSDPAKVKPEVDDEEPKKSRLTSIEDVNTDRVKALKRRKSRGEGLDSRPSAVKVESTDEEADWERELESGIEAEAEKLRQERRDNKSKSSQKVEHDTADGKKERTDDGDAGAKRRRSNEDDGMSERKRTKSTERGERGDWTDGDVERSKVGAGAPERVEDGELPSSSTAHDQSRSSPRQSDRRSLPPSGSHDKAGSPSTSKRHRDHNGRRDGHRNDRVAHSTRERDYHQSSHHHHQHRTDADRDRHHHKDRDWQDRDHKKVRHADHGS